MTRDELYPIIDWVLHFRHQPYMNAGSEWIDHVGGEPELRIHDLAEALCDALCKAAGDLTIERDASRLIINDLTVEIHWLRAAGDALAKSLAEFNDPEDGLRLLAWQEARRER